jgi:hypothetical protein
MNWGEFKNRVETAGVTDDFEIIYIEFEHTDTKEDIKICLLPAANSFYVKHKWSLNNVVADDDDLC